MTWYRRHGVSHHRQFEWCLSICFGKHKKAPKPALLTLCEGNPPVSAGFPPKGLVTLTSFMYNVNMKGVEMVNLDLDR